MKKENELNVWFAWFPVICKGGEWAWMEDVYWEEDVNAILGNAILGLCDPEYIYTKIKEKN